MAVSIAQNVVGGCITAFFHPLAYSKVLIQFGHEPLQPVLGKNLFRREMLYYPNTFKYIGHIYRMDGFVGLYRGLVPRLMGGFIGNVVQNWSQEKLKQFSGEEKQGEEDEFVQFMITFCKQTAQESASRCLSIVVSQPLHVIMLRSIAQFVGGETRYEGLFSSFSEIYQTEGIKGFFAGLIPRLIGELIQVWMCNLIAHLVNKYFIESKEMQSYTSATCGIGISFIVYPFQLVGNIMAVTGADLTATRPPNMPLFTGWLDCWRHLRNTGNLKRGSSMFWRVYTGPTVKSAGKIAPAFAY